MGTVTDAVLETLDSTWATAGEISHTLNFNIHPDFTTPSKVGRVLKRMIPYGLVETGVIIRENKPVIVWRRANV